MTLIVYLSLLTGLQVHEIKFDSPNAMAWCKSVELSLTVHTRKPRSFVEILIRGGGSNLMYIPCGEKIDEQ